MRKVIFLLGLPIMILVFLLSLQLFFQAFPEIWGVLPGASKLRPDLIGGESSPIASFFTIKMSAGPKTAAVILACSACACGSYLVQALETVRLENKKHEAEKR